MKSKTYLDAGSFFQQHNPIPVHRFKCHITEAPELPSFLVKSVKLPTLKDGKWDALVIDFYRAEKINIMDTINKIASIDTMIPLNVKVEELKPDGSHEATFSFEGANLTEVQLPELDYEKSDLSKVRLTFKNFKLNYVTAKELKTVYYETT